MDLEKSVPVAMVRVRMAGVISFSAALVERIEVAVLSLAPL